jgi:hypothetical protein
MKVGYKIKRIIAWLLLVVCLGWLVRDAWQPYYYNWRCGQIAADLNDRYGLVVRYGDPAEFYLPPFGP